MIAEARARQLLDRVLARGAKGSATLASLRSEKRGNTRFARNAITSSGDVDLLTLSVTVQFGRRSASATTNQLDDHSVDDVIARATRMAQLAPENVETQPPLGKQTYVKVTGAVDPATAHLAPTARAKAVGAAIAAGAAGKLTLAGYYEHSTYAIARATTAGLWAHHEATACNFTCTARTADGTGSGWAGTSSHRAGDLDTAALAKIAADKATRSAQPKKLDPGRYTVVLEPAAVAELLEFLLESLGARRADEGRSFFAKPGGGTKVGERLFPEAITLRSDPADPAIGGAPFDGEGFALRPTRWLDKGVLTGLTYSRYWAAKQHKQPTGSPNGWTLDGGDMRPAGSAAEGRRGSIDGGTAKNLLDGVKRGVLITRFWYLRDLDPQTILATGLTRDGTFLIENGELAGPVNNFRFNDSPVQMLATCDALGADWIAATGTRVPALRCHEFNLASISEAV